MYIYVRCLFTLRHWIGGASGGLGFGRRLSCVGARLG